MPRFAFFLGVLLFFALYTTTAAAQPAGTDSVSASDAQLRVLLDSASAVMQQLARIEIPALIATQQGLENLRTELTSTCKRGTVHLNALEAQLSAHDMTRKSATDAHMVLRELREALSRAADQLETLTSGKSEVQLTAHQANVFELPGESDTLHTIYFDDNSSFLTQSVEAGKLRSLAIKMKYAPELKIELTPYADASGDQKYSVWLTERRAQRIKALFVESYLLEESRIVVNKPVLVTATTGDHRTVLIREVK